MTLRSSLLPALLAALLACAGGGGSPGGGNPGGGTQPPPPPRPAASFPAPIPDADLEAHGSAPLNRKLMETFNHQVEALKADTWPFGEAFLEVDPDLHAGYAEGYFTLDPVHQPIRFMDGIQRPLIRAAAGPDNPMRARYEGLFEPGDRPWDPAAVRRVAGFLFTGSKAAPDRLARTGGLWCGAFGPDPQDPDRPALLGLLAAHKDLRLTFNLRSHLFYSESSGFVSLTRSVWVARHFAINTGTVGRRADAGYVYVVKADAGLDAGHPSLHAHFPWEQEVSVPGMVPWSRVVAWRRLERHPGGPGHGAPPEFTGPIHVRPGLRAQDAAAYARVVAALSLKSLYTKAHQEGADWRPLRAKADDEDYRRAFNQAHPRRDSQDPELWR